MGVSSDTIFTITNQKQFEKMALKVFRFQYENNLVYRKFCDFLKTNVQNVKSIRAIPFLPIQFFKNHKIISNTNPIQATFTSSGTTGIHTSTHWVTDIAIYEESYRRGFSQFYGDITNYAVLALLPSYLERKGSSLIYMVNDLIQLSNHPESGFCLDDYDALADKLTALDQSGQPVLLIGVTYALLDLIEKHTFQLKNTFIIETGGMKGKRKEMIRDELHELLQTGFGVQSIHSEYGMTELLSQAYSLDRGLFECPPWMQILIRDTKDALHYVKEGKTGGINVIDLANIYSCSFIATQDLGKKYVDGRFEILGRFDDSDLRGCNLMMG